MDFNIPVPERAETMRRFASFFDIDSANAFVDSLRTAWKRKEIGSADIRITGNLRDHVRDNPIPPEMRIVFDKALGRWGVYSINDGDLKFLLVFSTHVLCGMVDRKLKMEAVNG